MDAILQDFRYSLRILLKNRMLAFVAIVSMALGVGANTAVFSAVNAALLRALPYASVDSLVLIWGTSMTDGILSERNQVSATDVADLRAQNTVFEDVATYTGWVPLLAGQGEAERIPAIQVGDGYFKVMRGKPLLGRTFLPEEQQEGKDFVVVLGFGLWQHKFGGDPHIVGKTILLNGRSYAVVGVMPQDFQPLPQGLVNPVGQLYRPVAEPYDDTQRDSRHLRAIARLKAGVSLERAQAEMAVLAGRLSGQHPDTNYERSVQVVPLTEDTVGGIRKSLWLLFGAVAFVLLVACANISNLLLAQSAARQREITIRAALGASRARLIRQLLTESLMLSLTGGALGLLLAIGSARIMATLGAQVHPLLGSVSIDARVLCFTGVLAVLSGLLFGLAPSWHASHTQLAESLRGAGQSSATRVSTRIRGMLVASEIAITLVLLMCAVLFLQTVFRLRQVDPGFNPSNLLTMSIGLPTKQYPEPENWAQFYKLAVDRLAALPGVRSAAMTSVLPLSSNFDGRGLEIEGQPRPHGQEMYADLYVVTPDYLRAMEIPILQGRGIQASDTAESQYVALVNQAMARQVWPSGDAIGKRLRFNPKDPWRTVVGIVKDVHQYGLDQTPPPQFYLPHPQFPTLFNTLVLKADSKPEALVPAVRAAIRSLDPMQAVYRIATLEELTAGSIAMRRLLMILLSTLAFVALSMAAAGIYGVMSYSVAQRTREIGIRMALGAGRLTVFRLVVRQGMALASFGIALGLLGAIAATRWISALLFETSPSAPGVFAFVSIFLCGIALVACLSPAHRAASLDPLEAIRYE